MNKKIFSTILCMLLLIACAVPVAAVEEENTVQIRTLSISTTEELLEFAENCRMDSFSKNLEVTLKVDIDLSGTSFMPIPVFCGTFHGNDHTISGVTIGNDGSYQGLFRYITPNAVVQDLNVEAKIHPQGSRVAVGGIAGSNEGVILGCTFVGEVSGGEYIGGIAGKNAVTGMIEDCHVEGQIHGDHFVGGIVGENHGVIRRSSNMADINVTAKQNDVELSDITLDTLMHSEAANTTTDIGGIAGISSGVIRDCENRSNVGYPQIGYNIGGIAGTQSGYIAFSYNYGNIQGRKEVGGVVGQMEPVSQVEFTDDTLQILQEQLNTMSGLLDRTTGNVQSAGDQLSGQVSSLRSQTQTAKDAVEALIPSRENPHLPDMDVILAAKNTLTTTMDSMPKTMEGIVFSSKNMVTTVASDLMALSDLISTMCKTIYNASDNLGGNIRDVSDLDTPELLSGKVEQCINYASVLADMNAGGIAGAMAVENDLDIASDFQQIGDVSMSFQSDVRAVMMECHNSGVVTVKKQNVGGLAGWQSLGLVKNSTNTGKVDGSGGKYVGGVAGLSSGYLRAVSANCEVIGQEYLGGIAGSAMVVTDSLARVKLVDGRERVGGILGWAEENRAEEEIPIGNNYYLPVDTDCGAIDGISYEGIAQPLELSEFLAIENLPDTFKNVKIRFLFGDGTITEILVPAGKDFSADQIPEVPVREGHSGIWKDLDQADLTGILFDMTFETEYLSYRSTISSAETGEDGRPVVLLEGSFSADAIVTVTESDASPELTEKQQLLSSWGISSNEISQTAHLLYEGTADIMQLYVQAADGTWNLTDFRVDGSYLVFEMEAETAQVALVRQMPNYLLCYIVAGGLILVLISAFLILHKRKRTRGSESVQT